MLPIFVGTRLDSLLSGARSSSDKYVGASRCSFRYEVVDVGYIGWQLISLEEWLMTKMKVCLHV